MSVKVKVILVDGHQDWNVRTVETVLMPEFTTMNCVLRVVKDDLDEMDEYDLETIEETCVEKDGVITMNGEEFGHTFVLMS